MDVLKNITIVDFTRLLPGPLSTLLLAQMGARVIKIESPKRPDYARTMGHLVDGKATQMFYALNRLKENKNIDYNSEEGRKEVLELIRNADAVIEQFRPGIMKAWNLGYEDVKKVNPEIVYISLTGYGQYGTAEQEAGHDLNYLAKSGLLSLLKDDNGKPVIPGFQLADVGGGSYMTTIACLSALIGKIQNGKGGHYDVSMTDSILPIASVPISLHESGIDPYKMNVLDGKNLVNYGVYKCADEKWLAVGALEVKFWNNICKVVKKDEWMRQNMFELSVHVFPKKEVEDLFMTKTSSQWLEIFKGQDVCISLVTEIDGLNKSDLNQSRKAFDNFEVDGHQLSGLSLPIKKID